MELWYAPLIHVLGFARDVASGWDLEGGCFYRRRGGTCQEMDAEIARWAAPGMDGAAVRWLNDVHNKGSAARPDDGARPRRSCIVEARAAGHRKGTSACDRLRAFYTPAVAALVTRYARDDLVAFGWPEWKGNISEPWT